MSPRSEVLVHECDSGVLDDLATGSHYGLLKGYYFGVIFVHEVEQFVELASCSVAIPLDVLDW